MKKKFLELCRKSDFLLKKYQNNHYISIISSLHIIREHPIDLVRYKFVLNEQLSCIILNFIKSNNIIKDILGDVSSVPTIQKI